MAECFPALRICLERHLVPHLPPHLLRTLAGSLCAALLTWCVWQGCALVWTGCVDVCSAVVGLFSGDAPDATDVAAPTASAPGALPTEAPQILRPEQQAAQELPKNPGETRGDVLPWSLPYPDRDTHSLSGEIKRVDDILIQSLRRLGLDATRVATLQIVSREKLSTQNDESYPLQRAQVFLSGTPQEFAETVNAGLGALTEGTTCALDESSGRFVLRVHVNRVLTHELFLFKTGEAFTPPPTEGYPRLSILVLHAGDNTETARQWLSVDLPLAFALSPDEPHAAEVAGIVQDTGQEVLLIQPLGSRADELAPESGIVRPNMSPELMRKAILHNLHILPQSVGLINQEGDTFTADRQASLALAATAADNGLFIVDAVTNPASTLHAAAVNLGITALRRETILDEPSDSADHVLHKLRQIEERTRRGGQALVVIHARPETLRAVERWSLERDGEVAVVPLRYQPKFEAKP